MTSSPDLARVVVVQGPLQSLTAVSAVLHREAHGHAGLRNILLVGDYRTGDRERLKRATIGCAQGIAWDKIIDSFGIADEAGLRERVGSDVAVAEVFCAYNFQPANELALRAFDEAVKITYGDALGLVIDNRDDDAPPFDRVVAPVPQPLTPSAMRGLPWEVVAREHFTAAVDAARSGLPALRALDAELARFAAEGVLALTANRLGNELGTTLRGEAQLALKLVKRSAPTSHTPVVLKPHPRATAGQTGAIARLLREAGYPVRVITSHPVGRYPIELFRDLLHSVATTRSIVSSSTVSLKYLYGLDTDVRVPRGLAHLHVAPYDVTRFLAGARYYEDVRRTLETWQGEAPLPAWPRVRAPAPARAVFRLSGPLIWRLAPDLPMRDTAWRPQAALRAVLRREDAGRGDTLVIDDADAALCWRIERLPDEDPELLRALVVRTGDVEERTRGTLAALSRLPGRRAALATGVLPPTHMPAWRQKRLRHSKAPVPAGTELTMAQIEDLLEFAVDVLAAVPNEVGPRAKSAATRLRTPPGHAAFMFHTRPPTGSDPTAAANALPPRALVP